MLPALTLWRVDGRSAPAITSGCTVCATALRRFVQANMPIDALRMLVGSGAGWSVLPATLMDASLHHLAVDGLQLTRQLGTVWHPQRTSSRAADALRRHWARPAADQPA